jgi:hypothetical protein
MIFMLSCTTKDTVVINKQLMSDVSSAAIDLNSINNLYLSKDIRKLIYKSDKVEIYELILEAADLLRELSREYSTYAGGMTTDGEYLIDPFKTGNEGYNFFVKHKVRSRLNNIVIQLNALDTKNEDVISSFKYMIDKRFLSSSPYFDEVSLKTKPVSIILLDLMVTEYLLYVLILNDLNK